MRRSRREIGSTETFDGFANAVLGSFDGNLPNIDRNTIGFSEVMHICSSDVEALTTAGARIHLELKIKVLLAA